MKLLRAHVCVNVRMLLHVVLWGRILQEPDLLYTVTKSIHNQSDLESSTKEGKSPVGEMNRSVNSIPEFRSLRKI
jgi:hypothetical protein